MARLPRNCSPLLSGADGGRDVHLRDLGRRGIHLYGHLEGIDGAETFFTDDRGQRLATIDAA